ncbi:acetyltransferase (GNAT) family protein [Salsuginibacillus halophilus]|uniref:Acetyltransferase (GNAT) family protein n=1 Tax=Salsuginibacillus halophilus TaxID=517424 RepID=A0A2P8HY22_9BACI|nr:GNAT family N-acetyltransferase [Salsuginibacillus halophilus]PSL51097.1 acetyltransferase (GNAT) family protein [Salsuginibacillus halophilus]
MKSEVTISPALETDVQGIQKVAQTTWHDTYEGLIPRNIQDAFLARAYATEMLQKKITHTLMFVVRHKDQVVGFANAFIKDPERFELAAIYLLPAYQGQGVGAELFKALQTELPADASIDVEVEKGNARAEQFYIAKGFEVVEVFNEDFFGCTLQTVRMVKKR